jgi:hypothetical protein
MKLLHTLPFLLGFGMLHAQVAPVPTSWDAETALPPGFTTNQPAGSDFYIQSTCNITTPNPRSFRIDATGRFLQMEFAAQPGPISYEIGGQTGSANVWDGTFVVQESDNGTNWSVLKTYTGPGSLPAQNAPVVCRKDTVFPTNSNIRFVRFFFQNKISGNASTGGGNVKVDNIIVSLPPFTQPKLQVRQQGNTLFNGSVTAPFIFPVASSNPISLELRNLAVTGNALQIDSIRITGPQAAEFVITTGGFPLQIGTSSNTNVNFNFTPSAAGSREALMTVYSNDFTSDSVYNVRLYGIGGTQASDPGFSPQSIAFSNVKTYRYSVDLALPASGPDAYGGYLVLRSENAPVSGTPADGQTYARGETIGNAKVVYLGNPNSTSLSLRPNWIHANTTYHFAVFPYNGTGTVINYAAAPSANSVTTPATLLDPTYYQGIDPNLATFVSDLHTTINPHSAIFYSDYIRTMIQGFDVRDTFVLSGSIARNRVLTCGYSQLPVLYSEPFAFGATGTSREHSWPHSWMPTFPATSPELPEYNDQHNLFPMIQLVNELRCNYPLGIVNTVITPNGNAKLGLDAAGNRVFEPSNHHKGRVARALMYMAVTYNSVNGNAWNFNAPIGENCNGFAINWAQDAQTILNWHFSYPPTNYDIARNDFLDSLQGNRNPFVDNPNWACYIDFNTMTWVANPTLPCGALNQEEVSNGNLPVLVFPVPTQDEVSIRFWGSANATAKLHLTDLSGRTLLSETMNMQAGNNQTNLSLGHLPLGIYLLHVNTPEGSYTQKIVRQ